jgi:hypothetical protein
VICPVFVASDRIAADEVDRIGWPKSVLHAWGLVRPAVKRSAHRKRRPRRPMTGIVLHQDGSRHMWLPLSPRVCAARMT